MCHCAASTLSVWNMHHKEHYHVVKPMATLPTETTFIMDTWSPNRATTSHCTHLIRSSTTSEVPSPTTCCLPMVGLWILFGSRVSSI